MALQSRSFELLDIRDCLYFRLDRDSLPLLRAEQIFAKLCHLVPGSGMAVSV